MYPVQKQVDTKKLIYVTLFQDGTDTIYKKGDGSKTAPFLIRNKTLI